jgi:hypothetical protein
MEQLELHQIFLEHVITEYLGKTQIIISGYLEYAKGVDQGNYGKSVISNETYKILKGYLNDLWKFTFDSGA